MFWYICLPRPFMTNLSTNRPISIDRPSNKQQPDMRGFIGKLHFQWFCIFSLVPTGSSTPCSRTESTPWTTWLPRLAWSILRTTLRIIFLGIIIRNKKLPLFVFASIRRRSLQNVWCDRQLSERLKLNGAIYSHFMGKKRHRVHLSLFFEMVIVIVDKNIINAIKWNMRKSLREQNPKSVRPKDIRQVYIPLRRIKD